MKEKTFTKGSSRIAFITALFIMLAAFAMLMPLKAHAADVAGGTYKGMDWRITDSGVLELGKAGAKQVLIAGQSGEWEIDYTEGGSTEDELAARNKLYARVRNAWPWMEYDTQIKTIQVVGDIKVEAAMSSMFAGLPNLTAATGFENFDVSECNAIDGLFHYLQFEKIGNDIKDLHHGCPKLTTLSDISNWDTSNVYQMHGVFAHTGLSSINVSKWDTSSVIHMGGVFRNTPITSIDLSNWDFSNVKDLSYFFDGCANLTNVTWPVAEKMNTHNLKYMTNMFSGSGITSMDMKNFDTENVVDMQYLFYNCTALEALDISGWDTSSVKTMRGMFGNCVKLQSVNVSGFDTGNVTDMKEMFLHCNNLVADPLDVSNWDTGKVEDMSLMFDGCHKIADIKGLENWDTSKVKNMEGMFQWTNSGIRTADMLEFDTGAIEGDRLKDFLTQSFGAARAIQDKIDALKATGKTDSDPEVQQLAEIKSNLNKIADRNSSLTVDEKIDLLKETKKAYVATVIEENKQAAQDAIDYAAEKEAEAAAEPTNAEKQKVAEEALKAAHNAVNRVASNAAVTGKNTDKTAANNLAKQLNEGPEATRKGRLTRELTNDVTAANAINTSGKSAASVKALNDAIAAANEALANGDAAALSKSQENLKKAVAGLKDKSAAESAYDTAKAKADDAKAKTDEAKAAYDAAKAKAGEEAKKNPGSDAAVAAAEAAKKAAEDYAAKAAIAKEKADAANEAGKKTDDPAIRAGASKNAIGALSEKNNSTGVTAEAAVAYAEQLEKAAEIARNNGDTGKAAELEGKAAEVWNDIAKNTDNPELKARAEAEAVKKANAALSTAIAAADKIDRSKYTPESLAALDAAVEQAKKVLADPAATAEQKAAAAKAVTDAIKNLKSLDSKVGQEITVAKNVYVITKDPGATWDGEVSLKTAKNAKNVSVPKVVTYEGKSYEVNRVQAGAFRAKKIRKVTLGANIEKLDKNAFKKSKATTIVVKTKSLTKASVKGALKGSKVKTVQVKVGSKKVNKKFVKKYKKIFTKKNAGKKVTVK